MNVAQHKIVNALKTLVTFITKLYTKFYCIDMYIFYVSDHKLGNCSTILKYYRKEAAA